MNKTSKFGYGGAILKVDLSQGHTANLPTDDYVDRFIGGSGLAAKLYWDMVSPHWSPKAVKLYWP